MDVDEKIIIGVGVAMLVGFLAAELIWRPHYNAVHHCQKTGRIRYGVKGMAALEYRCDAGLIWEN